MTVMSQHEAISIRCPGLIEYLDACILSAAGAVAYMGLVMSSEFQVVDPDDFTAKVV